MVMTQSDLSSLSLSNRYLQLPEEFYSRLQPQPLKNPGLVAFSTSAASLIGLDPCQVRELELSVLFSGHRLLKGSVPLATVYSGHQFGGYSAQLGDGRALLLGEVAAPDGQLWELQLKGCGRTPYSRHGDGRASLRSVIREYLGCEAMAALGIPTTRALCIIGSETQIYRDSIEFAAGMLRLSPSHIRFGHFEYFYYSRQAEQLKRLADFVIEHHYPASLAAENPYLDLFQQVVERTATLVANWQAVGFCHGVLNTDNMSILGLTLDYGPFAFLDDYDPGFVSNRSDEYGRYAFGQQPSIALWNCVCLAQTLSGLVPKAGLEVVLGRFEAVYAVVYTDLMRSKLGLADKRLGDPQLIQDLLQLMAGDGVDYSRAFALLQHESDAGNKGFSELFSDQSGITGWLQRYRARIECKKLRVEIMARSNPRYILRSYLAEEAVRRAYDGDHSEIVKLLSVLRYPYQNQDFGIYSQATPEWGRNLSISCSS
ncbi:protein adenylyltransferase SelO [Amphritea sp. HPY]|uniref:protein adenylyltransferase SelO n=1 Tax=Amphritea sp. HPY TaxID=3421652 RepID=UPI003D7DA29F